MSASLCSTCRQRAAELPDGRCSTCAQTQAQAPTQPGFQIAPPAPPGPAPAPAVPPAAPPPGPPPPAYATQQGYYAAPAAPPAAPYAAGPPAYFANPTGLSTALVVLLILNAVALLASFGTTGNELEAVHDLQNGAWTFDYAKAKDADEQFAAVLVLCGLLILATGIVFLVWFHRTRVNAELFAPAGHRMSRGWAIGSWFTPIVGLWFPKQIANDIWRASTPWGQSPALGRVTAWWVLWLCFGVAQAGTLGGIGKLSTDVASLDELDRLESALYANLLASLLGIAAAILCLLYVRALSNRQLTKYHQGPVPPAPWPSGPAFPGPAGPWPAAPHPAGPPPGF